MEDTTPAPVEPRQAQRKCGRARRYLRALALKAAMGAAYTGGGVFVTALWVWISHTTGL
jgi:hypothetical protein